MANTKKIVGSGESGPSRYYINMGGQRTLVRFTRSGTKIIGETFDWSNPGWGQTVARESDKRLKQSVAPYRKQRSYVPTYLDLSVNTPGKYGVDY